MSADITGRLKDYIDFEAEAGAAELMNEAIAEIYRLRRELHELKYEKKLADIFERAGRGFFDQVPTIISDAENKISECLKPNHSQSKS